MPFPSLSNLLNNVIRLHVGKENSGSAQVRKEEQSSEVKAKE